MLKDDDEKLQSALLRFEEHLSFFDFKTNVHNYTETMPGDIANLIDLLSLSSDVSVVDSGGNVTMSEDNNTGDNADIVSDNFIVNTNFDVFNVNNSATISDNRFEGKFVSANVVNLSGRNLTKAEISLLSKGLKFVPTPRNVDRALLKEQLEIFGRKLRLRWHFRDDENDTIINPFRPKSKFHPKGKDAAIELYLSRPGRGDSCY